VDDFLISPFAVVELLISVRFFQKASLHLVFPQQEIIKGLFFVIFLMIRGCLLFTSALIFDVYISLFM